MTKERKDAKVLFQAFRINPFSARALYTLLIAVIEQFPNRLHCTLKYFYAYSSNTTVLFLQVKLSVFWEYAKSLTVPLSVCIVLFFIISEASAVSSGIWLAKWSSTDVASDKERDLFLGVYGALGMSQALFILCASIAMAAGSRIASRHLHQKMLVNIMHSPMSFFETTPQGRIMNRFSKDISGIDDMVPRSVTSFLRTFLSVIGTMFAITFATPIFLAVIVPLGALYIFIQVRPFLLEIR